jgi:hypothetical protein
MLLRENECGEYQPQYVLHNVSVILTFRADLNITSVGEVMYQSKHQTGVCSLQSR